MNKFAIYPFASDTIIFFLVNIQYNNASMGLFLSKTLNNNNAILGIWEITETLEYLIEHVPLSKEDQIRLESFSKIKRKLEWLCTRRLLLEMCGPKVTIVRNEFNKPLLLGSSDKISISHSGNYIAIILDKAAETGIDIQIIRDNILTIKNKFMSSVELNNVSEGNEIEHLHVYWGIKESLYKVYGRELLSFKDEILVEDFDLEESGMVNAQINKDDFQEKYTLRYEKLDNYMLVYLLNN